MFETIEKKLYFKNVRLTFEKKPKKFKFNAYSMSNQLGRMYEPVFQRISEIERKIGSFKSTK